MAVQMIVLRDFASIGSNLFYQSRCGSAIKACGVHLHSCADFVVNFSDLLFIKMFRSMIFDNKSDWIVDESWVLGLKTMFENSESFQDVDRGPLLDHR